MATILGSLFSIIVGNVVSQLFFDGVWSLNLFYFFGIIFGMCFMTVVIVYFSTRSVYKKPAKNLLE